MKTIKTPYDTLAFCGISGATIGPVLAMNLRKETMLVRKDGDRRNTLYDVAGYTGVANYLIVDDFINSGKTVKHIQKKIYQAYPHAKCVGVVSVQELEPNYANLDVYTKEYNLSRKILKEAAA